MKVRALVSVQNWNDDKIKRYSQVCQANWLRAAWHYSLSCHLAAQPCRGQASALAHDCHHLLGGLTLPCRAGYDVEDRSFQQHLPPLRCWYILSLVGLNALQALLHLVHSL